MASRRGGNSEEGGYRDEREGGKTGGRGQARRQRRRVEKMVDRGARGKGAGGMAAGWGVGNPALREFAPRSGACDWPHVAMVAGQPSQEFTAFFVEVAEQGGGVGCLSCISSMFACVVQSALRKLSAGIKILWTKDVREGVPKLICQWARQQTGCGQCICGWRRRQAKNRCVVHAIFLLVSRLCGATHRQNSQEKRMLLRQDMALKTSIQKNRCVGATA